MSGKEKIMASYDILKVLDKEKAITLLQHKLTKVLYIQKKLTQYNENVYEQLKGKPHSNIVSVIDYYKVDDAFYVIEEYFNGRTLEAYVKENGVVAPQIALPIITSICHALLHLHTLEKPIIHRDIKLSNIMIDHANNVKLIDFNISRLYDREYAYDTTILGTEGYAAPEQFGFLQTDARSDIYSCGIVLNYLLTGMHPKEYLYQGELGPIIEKCTNFDPSKRYANVQELLQALHACQISTTDTRQAQAEVSSKTSLMLPGFRTKRWWKMILAAFGYAFLILGVIVPKSEDSTGTTGHSEYFLLSLTLLAYIFLFTNYLNIQSKLPFFPSAKKAERIAAYIIYSLIIFVIYGVMITILGKVFT